MTQTNEYGVRIRNLDKWRARYHSKKFDVLNWWHGASTWRVTNQQELQHALDSAKPYDIVTMPAGITITLTRPVNTFNKNGPIMIRGLKIEAPKGWR